MSEEVKKDDKPAIPDDFFYNYDELVSKPRITGWLIIHTSVIDVVVFVWSSSRNFLM